MNPPNKDCRHCQNIGRIRKGCFICDKPSLRSEMRRMRAQAKILLMKAGKIEKGLGMNRPPISGESR